MDVKAIIPRSTHPVTVKLTCGERYDTLHKLHTLDTLHTYDKRYGTLNCACNPYCT